MTYLAVSLCIVLLALVVLLVVRERDHDKAQRLLSEDWALERRELLNRIQHPQVMPTPRLASAPAPEPPRDASVLAHIGQILPGRLMEEIEIDDAS